MLYLGIANHDSGLIPLPAGFNGLSPEGANNRKSILSSSWDLLYESIVIVDLVL